jgi:hypothetical protein
MAVADVLQELAAVVNRIGVACCLG